MLSSYLKIGFRNLSKNWGISFINIFGLALAIGGAITVFIFVDSQYNMDSFHSKKDQIYMLINRASEEKGNELWGKNPFLLAPDLKERSAIVENTLRAEFAYGNVRFEDRVFHEEITYVDPSFFEVFDFSLSHGDRNALKDKQNMVISQPMAEKYFGDRDPVGELISIKYPGDVIQSYLIAGVLDKYPSNSSFRFDIIVPMSNLVEFRPQYRSWDHLTDATFVQLEEGHIPKELEYQMAEYVDLHNKSTSGWQIEQFEFIPLDQMSLRTYELRGSISMGGHPAGRLTIGIISLILLILACFNYMNIAVASATRRLKEIALRKVLGGYRKHIIHQFIVENLILCSISMVIGVFLSYYLFLPGFNSMLPFPIPFSFSSFTTAFLFFGGMLLIVGLASGSYPALFISRFQPVSIFKGSEKLGRKNLFNRILLSIQLILAFTTVVSCFVFSENGRHFNNKDWGYDPKGLFTVVVQDEQQYNALTHLATSIPEVEDFSGSQHHINSYDPMTTINQQENQIKCNNYGVASNYPEIMNLRLVEGQFFEEHQNAEASSQVIVNTKFVEKMGWENALDQVFTRDSISYRVVGVIEGFYIRHFYSDIEPAFFYLTDPSEFLYFTFKVPHEEIFNIDDQVHAAWYDIGPHDPYNRTFQVFAFDNFYSNNNGNIALMGVISFFAIALGCLGLFGLLTFNLQRRMREFGIRKVLGARRSSILKQANKEYLGILTVSFFVGAPLGFFLMQKLLHIIYPEPQEMTILPFAWSIAIMLITVGVTITSQLLHATRVNPVDVLRAE